MFNIALNDELRPRFSPLHKKNVNKIYSKFFLDRKNYF